MTGQSVAFEQKFNYRRPMYAVLEYIWEIPLHQKAIKVSDGCEIFFSKLLWFLLYKRGKKKKVLPLPLFLYFILKLGIYPWTVWCCFFFPSHNVFIIYIYIYITVCNKVKKKKISPKYLKLLKIKDFFFPLFNNNNAILYYFLKIWIKLTITDCNAFHLPEAKRFYCFACFCVSCHL